MMINLFPIKVEKQMENFPLTDLILGALKKNRLHLKDNDILAISSKFVALSEGRIVRLNNVMPERKAVTLAKRFKMSPQMAQLVLWESDKILGGIYGFLLAVKDDLIAPNAGIDRSNIYPGFAILYPKNPSASAEKIRKEINQKTGKNIGIVLTDSRLMPARIGTTGVAISCAGIEPVQDCIGRRDLFGNSLKYTKRALADDIAAASELLMGEADESTPIVVVRAKKPPWKYTSRTIKGKEMRISWRDDIYIKGLMK